MDWNTKVSNREKLPRLEDLIDMAKLGPEFTTYRPVGKLHSYNVHWIEIRKKDGGKARIRKLCLRKEGTDDPCPYCDIGSSPKTEILSNAISRKEQKLRPGKLPKPTPAEAEAAEKGPCKGFRIKKKGTDTWTPVRAVRMTSSVMQKVQDIMEANKEEDQEKALPPSHSKKGFDIKIKLDKERAAAEMYSVIKGKDTKLSEEELAYHLQNIAIEKPEKLAVALKEAKNLEKRMITDEDESMSGDDDEKPKSKKGKGKRIELDDEDEDGDGEAEDVEDAEEEEEEAPKKKKKAAAEEEEEEEAEEEEETEEEEEEEEAPKKKKKRPEPEDDDDDDDDDEPAPKKKKKKPVEDDGDEEEEKPKKKKKPVDDDDGDEW